MARGALSSRSEPTHLVVQGPHQSSEEAPGLGVREAREAGLLTEAMLFFEWGPL